MIKLKKTIITAIVASSFLFAPIARGKNKDIDYKFLDENKKILHKVDYETFRSDLDEGKTIIKMNGQEKFLEDIIYALDTQPEFIKERGFNLDREVDKEEYAKFIFDYVLKGKLNYEIKTPTDVIVGINMALEYLTKYNYKMILANQGLGSDIDDDGRFDGVNWTALNDAGWEAYNKVIKNPEIGKSIAETECKNVDNSATDSFLMSGDGEPNAVEIVCRNYTSALEILFQTAREKYPGFTNNTEFVHLFMSGHVFGAFINKKTLRYIVVDPTWHDSGHDPGEEFDIETFVFPKDKDPHYDGLQDPNFFELMEVKDSCMCIADF